jgi:hypothetical protein
MNITWLANKLLPIIIASQHISNEVLKTILDEKYMIKPHLIRLWRARMKANELVEENHKKS